jgi:hypothetical protein
MEFFADKNTSCYCLATIKSASVGGPPRLVERLLSQSGNCIRNSHLFLSIPDAKLDDDYKTHTIIKPDNGGRFKPLNDKRKIKGYSSFSLHQI